MAQKMKCRPGVKLLDLSRQSAKDAVKAAKDYVRDNPGMNVDIRLPSGSAAEELGKWWSQQPLDVKSGSPLRFGT